MGNFFRRLASKPTHRKLVAFSIITCFSWLSIYAQNFKENFESGIRNDYWATEGLKSVTSNEYSVSGNKSYRSYIPLQVHSNPRCEIRFRGANGTPNWHPHFSTWGMKFAVYFPKDFKPDHTSSEYIAQFHSVPDKGDNYNNPPWALRLSGTKLSVTNRWIEKKTASNAHQKEKSWGLSDRIVPGKWHYFIVDIHWDYRSGGDGFMKFYMKVGSPPGKSDLEINYKGPTGYNDDVGSYFKLGLYKWDWKSRLRVNWSKLAGVQYREVYYDDFEIKKNGFGPAAETKKPPVADAGSDETITLPTNEIVLKGSGNDPDGTIKQYRWTQKSGPSDATLNDESTKDLEASKLREGVYIFSLTVEDNDGLKDSDEVKVTVKAPENQPPTAKAGPDITITLPTNSVDIEGNGTDPDDNINSYRWIQKSGPSDAKLQDDDKPTVKVSNLKEGSYAFEFTVIDEEGEIDRDRVVVTVEPPENQPPTAKAGPDITITLPKNSVEIEGNGTDPDDNINSYRWIQKSGPSDAELENDDEPTVIVSKLKEGRYAFELTVIDEEGEIDRDRVVVMVEPPKNQPPTAKAGPDINIQLPTNEVTIEGEGTDPDKDDLTYRWKQISGPSDAKLENTAKATLTASNLEEGKYAFELTVEDEIGENDSDRVIVTVGVPDNLSPSANAGPNINIQHPTDEVTINGEGKDPDDGVDSYLWIQISGPSDAKLQNADKATVKVSQLQVGRYAFELTVTDKTGDSDSDRVIVTVEQEAVTVVEEETADVVEEESVENEGEESVENEEESVDVEEAPAAISSDITDAICGASNGAIALSITGGNAPYNYEWSHGANGSTIKDLSAGKYQVKVTDDAGQVITENFSVNSRDVDLQINSTVQHATCGSNNGSIKVDVSGGEAPYNFEWSTNGRSASLNKLTAGFYDLVVSDQNGCSKKVSFEVGVDPGEMTLDLSSEIGTTSCAGNDGSVALTVNGNHGPLNFEWQHGVTGPTLNNLAAGKYQVTITDEHGCFMKSNYTVEQTASPDVPVISQLSDSLFVNQKDMQYQWYKDGQVIANETQQVLKITKGGRYWVEVANDQSCSTRSDYFFADDPFFDLANDNLINQIEFYPNPAVDVINVRLWLAQPVQAELTIYDFVGRIVKTKTLGQVQHLSTHTISVQDLASGTYLIRAKANNEIVTRRFIKP